MEDRLKPCPFCGGKARLSIDEVSWIYCEECCAETDCFDRKEEAIEAWNTRKPMDRIVEQLEKWKQEADKQYEDTDSELYKMASIGKYHAYKQAIEIVKNGGKDE